MPPRLFVAGSANIDLTFRVPAMPRPGVTEVCAGYRMGFGGKGANQAVQASRLGASVTFLGKVGDDAFGPAIVRQLQAEGINTEHVTVASGRATGTAVILVEPAGQNSIVTHAGPNVALTADDVCRVAPAIVAADALVATLEVPGDALLEAFRLARSADVRTVLNPAPPVTFPLELLTLVDLCVPNESEVSALTGLPAGTANEVDAAATALRQLGPKTVVVTLGERGAYLLDDVGGEHVACRTVAAVDSSGAGDSFTAGLAVALAEGYGLRDAVRRASAVAALSVTRDGTQASFPVWSEVQW